MAAEIERTTLSPAEYMDLTYLAKNIELDVGISFFIQEDVDDFNEEELKEFDFYKVLARIIKFWTNRKA